MAQPSDDEQYPNDIVSSRSLTLQTTGTLTSPPPLPTLTFDLIAEILSRLPVKLLIQLRCLGKYWKSLISDPKFAKKHLQSSIKRHHLMVSSTNNLNEFVLYDSEMSCVLSSTSIVKQTQINYPVTVTVTNGYREPSSLCSCDGILCFAIDPTSAILWNPSIRKLELLPPLENNNPLKRVIYSTYSFGYDRFIDNYKTVVVNFCIGHNEVSINTMGTDYWRRIHDFPLYGPVHRPGVFVSGTVNWLAYDASSSHSCAIVSLDLEKESYQKLSHPDLENDADMRTLGVVRDCLCIFATNDMFLDVWIMNEYGNKESWTKLYRVPHREDQGLCSHKKEAYMVDRGLYSYKKALYISKNDLLLMDFFELDEWGGFTKIKLVVYHSITGTLKIADIENFRHWIHPQVYIESLISPCS
jgi:F-box interacting protein